MVFGMFDRAFYINCDHRTDRRRFFEAQAAMVGIDVERFAARRPAERGKFATVGEHGCHESHLGLWRLVHQRGYGTCLIFEDDASFTKEGLASLELCKEQILSSPWDMLYFQVKKRRMKECESLPMGIHRIDASILLHAYAVRGTVLPYLIEMVEKNDRLPVDIYLYEHVHPHLKVYGVGPTVAFQLNSRSDLSRHPRPSYPTGHFTPVYMNKLNQ
jgi:GR25 family glycosyltransferase involved in LPS biosynthesis